MRQAGKTISLNIIQLYITQITTVKQTTINNIEQLQKLVDKPATTTFF